MIVGLGKNWRGVVAEMLQDDAIGALDENGVEDGLSASERVVARSVNELPIEEAKELFFLFATVSLQ